MPGHVNEGGVTIYAPSAPPGSGPGGAITLQDAYEGGNTISVSAAQGGAVTISGDGATAGMAFLSTVKQDAIQIYNTADATTNYERLAIRWVSDRARIIAEKAAGGTERDLELYAGSGQTGFILGSGGSAGATTWVGTLSSRVTQTVLGDATGWDFWSRITSSTTVEGFRFLNPTFGTSYGAASGVQTFVSLQPTINQSGTAGYNLFEMKTTETSVGSGKKNFWVASVGATQRVRLETVGTLAFASGASREIQLYNTADETTNYERLAIRWTSNVATITAEKAAGGTERSLDLLAGSGATGVRFEGSSGGFVTTIGSSGSAWILKNQSEGVGFQFRGRTTTGTTATHSFANDPSGSSFSASSGTQLFVDVDVTINQSGTAAYRALHIKATETATGSGAHQLIHAETAAAEYFAINTVLANGDTTIFCRVDRAGAETFERLLVGAVDTAGAGFRAIRIAN